MSSVDNDQVKVMRSGSEGAEIPQTDQNLASKHDESVGTDDAAVAGRASHEMTVPTMIHLLGLPSAAEIRILENKVDALTNEMKMIALKFDRLVSQLDRKNDDSALERIDYQISDVKSLIKKAFPNVIAASASVGALKEENEEAVAPMILTSVPDDVDEVDMKEQASESKEAQAGDDVRILDDPEHGDFQAAEGRRMREEAEEKAELNVKREEK